MQLTLQVKGFEALAAKFAKVGTVTAGVKVTGEPVKYALVWEWGTLRWPQPGPKTMWSTNPAGDTRILTITAPHGYIRVNHHEYLRILREEFHNIRWSQVVSDDAVEAAVKEMLTKAMARCAALISATAPIDTGALRGSIVVAAPNDPILEEGTSNEYGPTEFDVGGWV